MSQFRSVHAHARLLADLLRSTRPTSTHFGTVMVSCENSFTLTFCIAGLGVPKTKIWQVLQDMGQQDCGATDLNIIPMIYGERHNPSQKASVTNITPLNTNLGSVYRALCQGIITNLHTMMSHNFLLAAGVKRIVGSGTAIIKNSILSTEIRALYKLPLVLSEGSDADAAVGAALAVLL